MFFKNDQHAENIVQLNLQKKHKIKQIKIQICLDCYANLSESISISNNIQHWKKRFILTKK